MMAVPSPGTSERPRRGRGCDGVGRELPWLRLRGHGIREGPLASGLANFFLRQCDGGLTSVALYLIIRRSVHVGVDLLSVVARFSSTYRMYR